MRAHFQRKVQQLSLSHSDFDCMALTNAIDIDERERERDKRQKNNKVSPKPSNEFCG